MNEVANTTVLVIDDEAMVRDNIEEILAYKQSTPEEDMVSLAASILFDKPQPVLAPRTSHIPNFVVHKAPNGMEGLELVKKSLKEGHPYAVIFLDMRMPGWDGLETATQIRKYDKKAEIIFITAFSDRSIDEIITRAGQNVGYHCKPYAAEEILQLATKATADYNKLRNLEGLLAATSSMSVNEYQLDPLLENIFGQLTTYLKTDMALLGKVDEDNTYEKLLSIGTPEETMNPTRLIDLVQSTDMAQDDVIQIGETVLTRLDNYTIFALMKKHEHLQMEKLYLLKLYVQNATKAIRNAELHEKLLQKEKLSAIGQAITMVMHDLRAPLGTIQMLTNMMREEEADSEWLQMIDDCSFQATDILNDFLDFVRDTPIEKHPVLFGHLIDQSIQLTEARNGIEPVIIRKQIPADLILTGDENKLKRVFVNLINNAVEALQVNQVDTPQITISAVIAENDNQVLISLQDNGPGIPKSILKTLWDPFVSRDKHNGTGLGLAIVKQCITAHGGTIRVENRRGAVFTITLPLK